MKYTLIILTIIMLFSCKDDMAGRLIGGTIITIKGDTIEFYGGALNYIGFGVRNITDIEIKEKGD